MDLAASGPYHDQPLAPFGHDPKLIHRVDVFFAMRRGPNILCPDVRMRAVPGHTENHSITAVEFSGKHRFYAVD
jgi:hypothetical protein